MSTLDTIAWVVTLAALVLIFSSRSYLVRHPLTAEVCCGVVAVGETVRGALYLAFGTWWHAVWCAAIAAWFIRLWWMWHNRRRRDRAAGLVGEKSRARVAALVRRQAEEAR